MDARLTLIIALALAGCQTPEYAKRESQTELVAENVLRYGSIGGAGVGGYFAGKQIGKSPAWGAVGAGAGVAGSFGFWKIVDWFRGGAYKAGKEAGTEAARAEILNEKWKREAVYGLKPEGEPAGATLTRRVYVPSRTVNGVIYPGGYQSVQLVYSPSAASSP
jgi:hypothetical protein